MTFYEKVTGADLTKEYNKFNNAVEKLPKEYQQAWEDINVNLFKYSDFTGRNLIPILNSVLEMLIEMNSENKKIEEVFGLGIDEFCADLTKEMQSHDVQDKWRVQLNEKIKRKLQK